MLDQSTLTDRLAHLIKKRDNKLQKIKDPTLAEGLARIEASSLNKVLKAIRKIEEHPDTYGLCENCGAEIDLERLKSAPEAEHCRKCYHLKVKS